MRRGAAWVPAIAIFLLLTNLGPAPKAASSQSFEVLKPLMEVSGVSGREAKVREAAVAA